MMEDYSIEELYYSLIEDPGFVTQLSSCGTKQEVIELLGMYGVPAEYYEELKEFFYYDLQSCNEDLNGSTGVCVLLGFGGVGAQSCIETGACWDGEEASVSEGVGCQACAGIGVGWGYSNNNVSEIQGC